MLLYLAEKAGMLMPTSPRGRNLVLQRLFWQVGRLGPMARQIGQFSVHVPEKVPYAIHRYKQETARLHGVLDHRLGDHALIADIAGYPWGVPHDAFGQDLERFPHLARWFATIAARPATVRTYEGVQDVYGARRNRFPMPNAELCSVGDSVACQPTL